MVDSLARTTQILQRCVRYNDLSDSVEFKDNLLAVFIALIKFWAEATRWTRDHVGRCRQACSLEL